MNKFTLSYDGEVLKEFFDAKGKSCSPEIREFLRVNYSIRPYGHNFVLSVQHDIDVITKYSHVKFF